ncbi:MAG TPA: serine--tRNA ligase, partial [Conexibacter sp.]|nr:serine--tRNA ligase [Conexibacter sp.]
MLDLRLIRREPDAVRAGLARRGDVAPDAIDRLLAADERWRALTVELEAIQAEQNQLSRGRRGAPTPEEHQAMSELAARGRARSDEQTAVRAELDALLLALPNVPSPDAAPEDTVVREVGDATKTGKDHLTLAGDRIDMERGARLSGSRFAYLRGDLVLLELALVRWVLEKLRSKGFEPVIPPVLVRERALYGTGFLPDTEQQIYALPEDELYLVGTSEVA